MKSDIAAKLIALLKKDTYSEQDVVYFLVECKKILEQNSRCAANYGVLKFYRNWCCHSALNEDADKIFDEVYILVRAREIFGSSNDAKTDEDEAIEFMYKLDRHVDKVFEPYSFANLKKEITKFSKQFLDGTVPHWQGFGQALSDIISDTPLIIKKGGTEVFRFQVRNVKGRGVFDGLQRQIKCPRFYIGGGLNDGLFSFPL